MIAMTASGTGAIQSGNKDMTVAARTGGKADKRNAGLRNANCLTVSMHPGRG
jgi:hypothetical protein